MRCSDCSGEVRPVVALDIDGTLADYHVELHKFMQSYFGRRLPWGWNGFGNWEDYLGLTQAQYREAKLAFRQGGFKRWMAQFPGARNLASRARTIGAEIWITTTRPWMRLDSVDPDTREWLSRNEIQYDHLLYDEHKYPKLSTLIDPERLVFILDDLPEMIREAESVFDPESCWLISRPHNRADRADLHRVTDLYQAITTMTTRVEDWSRIGKR